MIRDIEREKSHGYIHPCTVRKMTLEEAEHFKSLKKKPKFCAGAYQFRRDMIEKTIKRG